MGNRPIWCPPAPSSVAPFVVDLPVLSHPLHISILLGPTRRKPSMHTGPVWPEYLASKSRHLASSWLAKLIG